MVKQGNLNCLIIIIISIRNLEYHTVWDNYNMIFREELIIKNADLVLKSNSIFTGLNMQPISGGIAVERNKIIAVKEGNGIDEYIGNDTKVLEYKDKLIMPGFIDAHFHLFMGAVTSSNHACSEIVKSTSEAECIEIIKKFAAEHKNIHCRPRFLWGY